MKSAAVIAAMMALAVCVSARTGGQTRTLQGFDNSAWCRAGSKLRIRVTSGTCTGVVSADCAAFSAAFGQWAEDAKEWIATAQDGQTCYSNTLESYAEAHASAVASVLVNTLVDVSCTGQGFACGYAVAEGSALAKSVAQALATAFVDADPTGEHGGTFCAADVEALAEVLAKAVETARSQACAGSYESVEVWTNKFAQSIKCALATAYVRANAKYCAESGDPYSTALGSSKCEGEGTSYQLCDGF